MALFNKKVSQETEPTFYWKRFERGRDYIYRKGLITKTTKNWNFYIGKQWEGVESGDEKLPSYPFIEGVIKYKVSTIAQNNMVAKFSDMDGRQELNDAYDKMNNLFSRCWERANMERRIWNVLREGAVTGDGVFYFGTSDFADVELIQNTNIFYGDESEPEIQKQPYLILWQRRSVKDVRAEAELNGVASEELSLILPDHETQDVVGNKDELDTPNNKEEAKVTCIIHLEKKGGVVHVCKSTKNVIYEPEHPIAVTNPDGSQGRGMSLYPLVKFSWKDYPNDARGVSEVEQLIPNQIEINKTLARRSQIIKLTAFPRLAYDSNAITNPEDLENVGSPIEVTTGGVQSINQMISYLNPATSNNDAKNYADDLLNITQELVGAGETARGNIELNRVASSAILAVRDMSAQPLNEQVSKLKEFAEDLAWVCLDITMVYNPNGIEVLVENEDPVTGMKSSEMKIITKEEFDAMKPNIRIDTSNDNPWTKEAEQTWLDNALAQQHITFEEYVELLPTNGIAPKVKLETIMKRRMAQQELMQAQQQMMYEQEMQNLAEADARGDLNDIETPSES